tara:strand:+ start:29 stop:688 length:660 start_codon:yes stop_codon:yes gene_type:complete
MKSFKTLIAATSLGLLSLPLFANENNLYFSAGGGQGFVSEVSGDTTISGTKYDLKSDMESSFNYDFEIGKKIDKWRLGISYASQSPKQKNITATTGGVGVTASISPKPTYDVKSFMFNIYRDFPNDGKWTPYAGIGLGSSNIKMKTYTTTVAGTDIAVTDDGRDLFSWDIKGGVTYNLNETTDIYGEVVYHQTGKFNEDTVNYDAIKTTNLMAGVRFNF